MMLDEAIAEIGRKADEYQDAWFATGSPHRADPYWEGKSDAMFEALRILELCKEAETE